MALTIARMTIRNTDRPPRSELEGDGRVSINAVHGGDGLVHGPPPVMMKNWSKARSEPATENTSTKASVGRSSGSVM